MTTADDHAPTPDTVTEVGRELSAYCRRPSDQFQRDEVRALVDRMIFARAETAADALVLVFWSTSLLRHVLAAVPEMPNREGEIAPAEGQSLVSVLEAHGQDTRHLAEIATALTARATQALENETGMASDSLDGAVRFNQ